MPRPYVFLLLAAASGCDFIFRLDRVPTAAIDAGTIDTPSEIDAELVSDAPMTIVCPSPAVDDLFTGTEPCASWGVRFANSANVTSGGGELRVTITSTSVNADGGCNSTPRLFAAGGVIVHLTSVTAGANSFNGLQVVGTSLDAALNVNDGLLKFQTRDAGMTFVEATYDPSLMAWLRLWPDRGTGEVVASYSADGQLWAQLGRQAMSLPQMATFTVIGGVNQGGVYSGFTQFKRFIICQ